MPCAPTLRLVLALSLALPLTDQATPPPNLHGRWPSGPVSGSVRARRTNELAKRPRHLPEPLDGIVLARGGGQAAGELWRIGSCVAGGGKPTLRFVDVGQGSALVVDGGGQDVVVFDSGNSGAGESVLAALEQAGTQRVALWMHTHFDADHAGGVTRVLSGMDGFSGTADDLDVDLAWDRGVERLPSTDVVDAYFDSPLARRRIEPQAGETWRGSGLALWALRAALDDAVLDENARGLAACVEVDGLRLLVLGDLPEVQARAVSADCHDVDVLWASHHGSADGISPELLELVSPDLVVVSAGDDNPYCHPSPTTMALLAEVPTYVTGVAATDPAAACGDLAARWSSEHRWSGGDVCVWRSSEVTATP